MTLKYFIGKYFPEQNDPVDEALANFINQRNFSERSQINGNKLKMHMRMMFIRVKHTIYYYDNRKVLIDLINNRLIVHEGGK